MMANSFGQSGLRGESLDSILKIQGDNESQIGYGTLKKEHICQQVED